MHKKQYTRSISLWMIGFIVGVASINVQAQQCAQEGSAPLDLDMQHWMSRIELAAKQQSFIGTYIIVQPDQLTTLQTIHIYDQGMEYELVSKLGGEEQQVYRQNNEFYAVSPRTKQVILERQSVAQMFPSLVKLGHGHPDQFYKLTLLHTERFIGREADVICMTPVDDLRFGYKAWVDQATGLLLRLDVENADGDVLQRFSFTNIEFTPPVVQKTELLNYGKTLKAKEYQVQEWPFMHTTPQKEGWSFLQSPAGFEPVCCVLRPLLDLSQELIQWVFLMVLFPFQFSLNQERQRLKTNLYISTVMVQRMVCHILWVNGRSPW